MASQPQLNNCTYEQVHQPGDHCNRSPRFASRSDLNDSCAKGERWLRVDVILFMHHLTGWEGLAFGMENREAIMGELGAQRGATRRCGSHMDAWGG